MWKNSNGDGNHRNGFSAVFMDAHTFGERDWYLDSGASVHITRCKDWLQDVTD